MPNPEAKPKVCKCGKGYTCGNLAMPHYGVCRPCYTRGMSRKKRKAFEDFLYKQGREEHATWEQDNDTE